LVSCADMHHIRANASEYLISDYIYKEPCCGKLCNTAQPRQPSFAIQITPHMSDYPVSLPKVQPAIVLMCNLRLWCLYLISSHAVWERNDRQRNTSDSVCISTL